MRNIETRRAHGTSRDSAACEGCAARSRLLENTDEEDKRIEKTTNPFILFIRVLKARCRNFPRATLSSRAALPDSFLVARQASHSIYHTF